MAQQEAALQGYSTELVRGIEELVSRRAELSRQVAEDEEEKRRLQRDLRLLSERLSSVNRSLAQSLAARAALDRTVAETQDAYSGILETSWSLLGVLEQEEEAGTRRQEAGNRRQDSGNRRQEEAVNRSTEPRRKEH